ncbi:clotting factor C-like [Uloborus diversus]|uniref:clotting factor C-like n=1 Tax=Uloborus diversus TaxID=327109 RepID=UPI002409A611|nr:clotting factor C-like [Uloborus diversus]
MASDPPEEHSYILDSFEEFEALARRALHEGGRSCNRAQRWKIKCKPCNDVSPEDICPRYSACLQCHSDGGNECATCPDGKFGRWCENACKCINGGTCERDGKCTCPDGYHGRNCEKKRGCSPPPPVEPPLEVQLSPPDSPMTAVYRCGPEYVLKGPAVSTCLSNQRWSSSAPECLLKCPLLSAPANGGLKFSGNELVEGVTAEVSCNPNHRLVGQRILACMRDGHWSSEIPTCEELASCSDPGNAENGERALLPGASKVNGHFIQDSKIEYICSAEYEMLGSKVIVCTPEGTWSDEVPSCVKVSTVIPDCETKGSEVIGGVGVSIRILCPPECAEEDSNVWGTSIYRADSSVCRAAIHSAKVTNSGGGVAVINNGPYSHFTGSDSNNVKSDSYPGRDKSFRFDRLPSLVKPRDAKDCDKGLVKLEDLCVYISNTLRTQKEANAICSNLGLQMEIPNDPEEKQKLAALLRSQGLRSVWAGPDTTVMNYAEISNATDNFTLTRMCPAAVLNRPDFKTQTVQCDDILGFVCVRKPNSRNLAICEDPGPVANGVATPVGTIDDVYYVGSSIEYSCQSLHYLRGAKSISCTGTGNWSEAKPHCIKVDACEDPPIPINGFVTYLPPLKTASAQRSAVLTSRLVGTRMGRLPAGLAAPLPENFPTAVTTTPVPETVSLPPGVHGLGVRAMYDCESRYYKLIGSRTRRCQEQGQWSGRPPTCIPICGRSDSPRTPFIVNGNATDIGQWPWQAGLARYLPDYSRWFLLCGASLLNEHWVITAAHCVTFAGTTLAIEMDKFQVYLGKYHRKDSKDDEYVQVRKIQEIHIHPDYDPGLFDADIALLRLDSPVQLNTRVQPVCLPTEQTSRDNLVTGKKGVVTGWGMNENETYAETLQQAVLPVVSRDICEKGYEDSDLPLTVTENMFCAGYARGRIDACSGDSGGPMVFTDESSKERKWVLEGIVSWGSPRGCGNPDQYGGFTRVSEFLDWIHLYF